MNIQESIERMIRDTIRFRCSKVLLSPDLHRGCLDRIADRAKTFGDIGPAPTSDVFVRGVSAEKCEALSGAEYALVPKSPDDTVTINGVPVEFIPPTTDPDEKLVFAVKQSVIDEANQKMDGWKAVEVRRVASVPVYELHRNLFNATSDEQRPFHHFDSQKLICALGLANCHNTATMEFVAGAMLDPAVRKKVLEARVFEPE